MFDGVIRGASDVNEIVFPVDVLPLQPEQLPAAKTAVNRELKEYAKFDRNLFIVQKIKDLRNLLKGINGFLLFLTLWSWVQWYPEAARLMTLKGAEMLVYPTAIGWNPDDPQDEKDRQREAWITIQRAHAIANGVPVISVNRCGFEEDPSGQSSGIDFWGSSFIAGPQGEILRMAFENSPEEFIETIDMDRTENVRNWWPFLRDRRIDSYNDITARYLD